MPGKLVLVGAGLIGGSFALALKQAGAVGRIAGFDRDPAALARARALGIVDEIAGSWDEALRDADLVMLAAPVAQSGAILAALAPHLRPGTVVTDAGSTKSDVIEAARAALGGKIAQFVPGHPIAGAERNGPDAARADLFVGKKTVLTPLPENAPQAVERVSKAWQACGAVIHVLTARQHDDVFAAVSHLPHLLAFALVDDLADRPDADLLFQFAASGFRDFTRIAASNPTMWRDVFLSNKDAVLDMIERFSEDLSHLKRAIVEDDGDTLFDTFTRTRAVRLGIVEQGQDVAKPDFGRHSS
jgi:prephenate dehydrogenase